MTDIPRFVLFSIGVGVAAASSVISLYILYLSLLGKQSIVYESNPLLALIEMIFLVLAVGTCLVASEIYYKYLKITGSIPAEKQKLG